MTIFANEQHNNSIETFNFQPSFTLLILLLNFSTSNLFALFSASVFPSSLEIHIRYKLLLCSIKHSFHSDSLIKSRAICCTFYSLCTSCFNIAPEPNFIQLELLLIMLLLLLPSSPYQYNEKTFHRFIPTNMLILKYVHISSYWRRVRRNQDQSHSISIIDSKERCPHPLHQANQMIFFLYKTIKKQFVWDKWNEKLTSNEFFS